MGYFKKRVQKELDDLGSLILDINERLISLEKHGSSLSEKSTQTFTPPKGEISKVHHLLEVNFKIKERRMQLNISQTDLAKLIDRSHSYVCRLEKSNYEQAKLGEIYMIHTYLLEKERDASNVEQ